MTRFGFLVIGVSASIVALIGCEESVDCDELACDQECVAYGFASGQCTSGGCRCLDVTDGDADGDSDGDSDGDADGDADGDSDGDADGDADGDSDGDADGDSDGDADGDSDGDADGDVTLDPGTTTLSVTVAGSERQYVLHVPPGFSGPGPLLVALHGNGDSAANFLATSDLGGASDRHGFLLALPQGVRSDTLAGPADWDAYARPASSNQDFLFIQAVLADIEATGGVDSRRRFLLGYSQGGYMAFFTSMNAAETFGAVHVHSAANPMPGAGLVEGAGRLIPVDILIGTDDWAISQARSTRSELEAAGHEVRYEEISGWGHVPFRSERVDTIWSWLAARPLP
jgi:predicted esterase